MAHSDYTGFYYQDLEEQKKSEEEKAQEKQPEVIKYEDFERNELKNVKNDDLKKRLDELEIEFDSKTTKEGLINLLVGEEEPEEGEENAETEQGDEEGQETQEEQTEEQEEK